MVGLIVKKELFAMLKTMRSIGAVARAVDAVLVLGAFGDCSRQALCRCVEGGCTCARAFVGAARRFRLRSSPDCCAAPRAMARPKLCD